MVCFHFYLFLSHVFGPGNKTRMAVIPNSIILHLNFTKQYEKFDDKHLLHFQLIKCELSDLNIAFKFTFKHAANNWWLCTLMRNSPCPNRNRSSQDRLSPSRVRYYIKISDRNTEDYVFMTIIYHNTNKYVQIHICTHITYC